MQPQRFHSNHNLHVAIDTTGGEVVEEEEVEATSLIIHLALPHIKNNHLKRLDSHKWQTEPPAEGLVVNLPIPTMAIYVHRQPISYLLP